MAQWQTGEMMANGIRINYTRTGGEKPPLVLSHASTDYGRFWTPVARALEPDYDVIMYDQRGHGRSDAPAGGYDFETQALDLADLIAALDLESPRAMGHSGGAAIVTAMAAEWPGLLSCLILEDPPWGSGWGGWAQTGGGLAQWIRGLSSKTREEMVAHRRRESPAWPEEEVELWAEGKLLMSPNAIQIYEQPEPPWRDWLRRIGCPILVITSGPEATALNTAADVEEMAGLWRQGSAVRIDGAGHMIHSDQFEAFMAAVRGFLAEVDGGEAAR